ncbi:MAG: putative branched-chain amino acid transport ATP-binding protein LivG [Methanomassiliicoccales archaeon PtaU1.Bin124]|nr:MAG: putative branched-chain amino acid transport ATP-binding protein LivG [Methanomassiliicoccales archaeon PtaU1.Bin124]
MTVIVEATNVSKWYGKVIGLNNFSLKVEGGITGIVGPNGAGKSTLFKILTGNIKANVGDLTVLGQSPWRNPAQLAQIGFCPDYDFLPGEITGREYLRYVGGLHGMSGDKLKARTEEVLELVAMSKDADRNMGGYSKGMKQRLKIAGAMLHDPQMLLLDEPLTGTDPVVRKEIIDLIKDLHAVHGHDVIVSSHVLHEIERMTHRVALIYKGRAVATGDISEIRQLMSNHPHHILVEGNGLIPLAQRLLTMDFTVSVELRPDRRSMVVMVGRSDPFFDSFPGLVKETGSDIARMESMDDDLESVFKYLVG